MSSGRHARSQVGIYVVFYRVLILTVKDNGNSKALLAPKSMILFAEPGVVPFDLGVGPPPGVRGDVAVLCTCVRLPLLRRRAK